MAAAQRKKKFYFWRPVIKTTRSRSLFKALDLICICKPITWSYLQCEEAKKHKMSAVITSSSFTCCEQKDTFASPSFVVIWIAVLFQSFEWSLLISNRIKPKFFGEKCPAGVSERPSKAIKVHGLKILKTYKLCWRTLWTSLPTSTSLVFARLSSVFPKWTRPCISSSMS